MLHLNPEIVCGIIDKARLFHSKESVVFDENIPDIEYEYDWLQILADHKDDLSYREVTHTILDLEPDQKVDLLALMYVGRGDFNLDEWTEARKAAKQNIRSHLTEYLFSKPFIADYLEEGLQQLGYSCENNV